MEGRADGAVRGAARAAADPRGERQLSALALALVACGPATPEAWIGVDQAVVLGGRIVADVTASRVEPDGTWVRKTDRCHLLPDGRTERCALPPEGRSALSRVGDLLVDDRVTPDGERRVALLDPETLSARATLSVGLPTEGRVVGGAVLPRPSGGLVIAANHGMSGVQTDDGVPAAWTIEGFGPEGGPVWRKALDRFPDQILTAQDLLLVHHGDRWRALDPDTGGHRWEALGAMGGCVGDGALWLAERGLVRRLPLDGSAPVEVAWEPPGNVVGCVWWDGSALFHGGGVGRGDGWLGSPSRPWIRVPHVDPELADHVDGDALWLHELGRGLSVVRPGAGEVGPSLPVQDVVRLGASLARFRITPDRRLRMTLETGAGEASGDRLVSPRAWHVDGDTFFTFASIASRPEELVRRWRLPDLSPLE